MTSALDLLDNLGPAAIVELVPVREVEFPVRGMTLREWATVIKRFPGLDAAAEEAASGGAPVLARRVDAVVENLDMAIAVIAIGFGCPGDAATEKKIEAKFSDDEIQALFDAVIRLTRSDPRPLAPGAVPSAGPANPGKARGSASSSSSTSSSPATTSAPT